MCTDGIVLIDAYGAGTSDARISNDGGGTPVISAIEGGLLIDGTDRHPAANGTVAWSPPAISFVQVTLFACASPAPALRGSAAARITEVTLRPPPKASSRSLNRPSSTTPIGRDTSIFPSCLPERMPAMTTRPGVRNKQRLA